MKITSSYKLFVGSIFICLINSCSLIDPASPTASYLHIDSISFSTNYAIEGSKSKKITDAWILYDNKYLGTFPLPATIPLIGEGTHKISIKGGIIENGISGSRAAYPMFASFDTTVNLIAKNTLTISPGIVYKSGTVFPQLEDFDDASLTLITTNVDNAPLTITTSGDPFAFEGNSGKVTMDANKPVFEIASSAPFTLPTNIPVYVELNYKSDVDFSIGAFLTSTSGIFKTDLLSVRASTEWKKIYVTYSELGGVEVGAINYKIFIHAEKGNDLTTADLYIDNLKVLY